MNLTTRIGSAIFLATAAIAADAGTVTVQSPITYSEDAIIADNIKRECTLDTQLAESLQKFAGASGSQIVFTQAAPEATQGEAFRISIVDAVSAGNAFIGHHKAVAVRAWLYRDGQRVATVTDRRNTMGGAFAGFKGSCTVLYRATNAIGKDLATWLQNPVDGARLGDL